MAAQTDPRQALAIYARIGRAINERLSHLCAVVLAGAQAGDGDLRPLAEVTEQERLAGTAQLATFLDQLGALRPGLTVCQAGDLLWALTAPELFRRLIHADRIWTLDEFEDWIARAMADAVLAVSRRPRCRPLSSKRLAPVRTVDAAPRHQGQHPECWRGCSRAGAPAASPARWGGDGFSGATAGRGVRAGEQGESGAEEIG